MISLSISASDSGFVKCLAQSLMNHLADYINWLSATFLFLSIYLIPNLENHLLFFPYLDPFQWFQMILSLLILFLFLFCLVFSWELLLILGFYGNVFVLQRLHFPTPHEASPLPLGHFKGFASFALFQILFCIDVKKNKKDFLN